MLQPSFSIYRGYSNSGIGELPSDLAGTIRGEQYLAADPALWRDPGLANEARKWMTLYDDQRIVEISYRLGHSIEAWSYFAYGGFRFVVRLVSGGEFASRIAYFAHAQAWRVQDFHGADDPGAILGCSEAFHSPWREGQPIQSVPPAQTKMLWLEVIQNRARAAIRLVAQLYRACVTGCPVVMGVPFREFVTGGSLHQLVSFARAALPLEIKRDCRIRIFTGRPESYLAAAGSHLLVVPEELASSSLAAQRDTILLDLNCELKSGAAADSTYVEYAQEVLDRALKLPDSLLACTGRLPFPAARPPSKTEIAEVAPIYNLVAASRNQVLMDDLFDHFCKEAATRNAGRDWKGIIEPPEWKQFSQAKLIDLAFSRATSADLYALRKQTRKELAARKLDLDEQARQWIAGVEQGAKSREILDVIQAKLLSYRLCLALLKEISPHELSPLLDNPEMVDLVVEILSQSEISDQAAAHLTQHSSHVRAVVQAARDVPARRRAADILIKSLAGTKKLPAGLNEADLLQLPPPEPNTHLENYLNWAEVLSLAGSSQAQQRIAKLGSDLKGREVRRQLFKLLPEPRFTALQSHFVTPEAWDSDLGDLLLDSVPQMGRIPDTGRIASLALAAGPLSPKVQQIMDERMEKQPRETTRALVSTGTWLVWRLAQHNFLTPFSFRDCAVNWILSDLGFPRLEEWKQVILDLQSISAEDLRALRSRFPGPQPPWPQVPLFQEEQLCDVARLCADLGTVAELAETVTAGSPDYESILRHSNFAGNVSAQALWFLSHSLHRDAETQDMRIGLDQALYLARNAGSRRAQALVVLGQIIVANLPQDAMQAEAAASELGLWSEPFFQRQIVNWLGERPLESALEKDFPTLEMLSRHFEEASVTVAQSDPVWDKLAWCCFDQALTGLADLLQPGLYARLVRALMCANPKPLLWKKLIDKIKNFHERNHEWHPLLALAKEIKGLPPRYQRKIYSQGWSTFKTVCRLESSSSCLFVRHVNVVPVLHLVSALRADVSLGAVASGIFSLAGVSYFFADPKWWEAFFDTIESCRQSGEKRMSDRMEIVWSVLLDTMQSLPQTPEIGIKAAEERMERALMSVGQNRAQQTLEWR